MASESWGATRGQLAELVLPEPMGDRHRPVGHLDLVKSLERVLREVALRIDREQIGLANNGSMMFGVFDVSRTQTVAPPQFVEPHRCPRDETDEDVVDVVCVICDDAVTLPCPELRGPGYRLAIGLRSGNRQESSMRMVVGGYTEPSDGLMLAAEFGGSRRHTGDDLDPEVRSCLHRWLADAGQMHRCIEEMRDEALSDVAARLLIFDIFESGVIPSKGHFDRVVRNYFKPQPWWTDVTPRSRWGVFNAFVRSVKSMRARPAFMTSLSLGKRFGLSSTAP